MNLKRRILSVENVSRLVPQESEALAPVPTVPSTESVSPPPFVSVSPAPAAPIESVAPSAAIKPVAPSAAIEPVAPSAAPPESRAPLTAYERKMAEYGIPWILSVLLTDAKNPKIVPALQEGSARARERGDEFYATIFEGALAANRVPPDVSSALPCFHRAFDLSGGRADGFLHGMVWNLYANSGADERVAELLDRARSELKQDAVPKKPLEEALRTTMEALKQNPEFDGQFKRFQEKTDMGRRRTESRIFRESRLPGDRSLLFFPGAAKSSKFEGSSGEADRGRSPGHDYFVDVLGAGTAVDPTADFLDGFFRIGGAIDDLRNLVFSASWKVDSRCFSVLRRLFSDRPPTEKIRVFATRDGLRCFENPLDELVKAGLIEVPRDADSPAELCGGGTVRLSPGSVVLKTPSGRTIQFVDTQQFGADEFERNDLSDGTDILVSTLDWLSSVHYAKANKPALCVIDLPANADSAVETMTGTIRKYLEPESVLAFSASSLVVDIDRLCFLDAIKALDDPRGDCWTELSNLVQLPFDEFGDGEMFSVGQDDLERSLRDRPDILENIRFHQRRRQGLYFKKG